MLTGDSEQLRACASARTLASGFQRTLSFLIVPHRGRTVSTLCVASLMLGVSSAAVFAARGGYTSPAEFTRGFGPALGACAGLALLGAVAGLALPGKQRPAPATQTQQPRETKPLETRR